METRISKPYPQFSLKFLTIPCSVALVDSDMPALPSVNFCNSSDSVVFSASTSTLSRLAIHSFNFRSAIFLSVVSRECSLRLPPSRLSHSRSG